jgi:NAD(P)-dependent dehydrogenase (short-subunit alcohol dehydrogenase family)
VIAAIPGTIPRAALITHGETEIGLTLAHTLAEAGFAIALQCAAPLLDEPPEGTEVLRADLSVETRTATLIDRATARLGAIGVLINAAGTASADAWLEPTRVAWDAHFEINARAPLVLTKQFAIALPDEREGVVINLVDQRLDPNALSWTAANAALWALTRAMALALAPRIRVNAIAVPSGVAAESLDAVARAAIAILGLASMTGQMMEPAGAVRAGSG